MNADLRYPVAAAGFLASLAAVKFLAHLFTAGAFGYSYYVDELYFLALAEHLDWGYVDMPPLYPALTAGMRFITGDSLPAIRILPALAGAGLVLMTGLLAREMGGGKFAQALSALAVLLAPIYLLAHGLNTMNSLEPLFWTGCAWILLRLGTTGSPRLWLLLGLTAGLAMLNKHSMIFFGVGVLAGLLLTTERRHIRSRWFWLGGALAFLIVLPNLIWMVRHDFPHLELLANIRADQRNVNLSSLQFLWQQVLMFNPIAFPIWAAGLVWLMSKPGAFRLLGITYWVILAQMLLLDGRVYYMAPAYPFLLAAGGVALERWFAGHALPLLKPAYVSLLGITGLSLAPMALPCLPPETFIAYSKALHLEQPRVETHRLGPLPQLFADRFGWKEMAEAVARIYHQLPPEERVKAAIFGDNFGQAGAIDLYGPSLALPKAVSGHLTYHYWGPREYTGEVVIVLGGRRSELESFYERVEPVGSVGHPYAMPYEHFDLYLCRGLKMPMAQAWPHTRNFH